MTKRIRVSGFSIALSENTNIGIETIQLLRTGTFMHPQAPGGKFTLDEGILRVMRANFMDNTRRLDGQEVAVDYSHESGGKASGWIKALELREDDSELWATIDWTPNAAQAITEREFRYISADIDFGYVDNETGKNHGPVLMGAGLTNRPHVKDMKIILNEQTIKGVGMDLEQILAAVAGLGDDEKKKVMDVMSMVPSKELEEKETILGEKDLEIGKKDEEIEKKEVELSEVKTKLEESDKKLVALTETVVVMDKEKAFNVLLTDGKIVPGQKAAFMEMSVELSEKFFANAEVKLNLSEKGHGLNGNVVVKKEEKVATAYDTVSKMAVELSEKDKINYGDAISIVLSENAELNTKYIAETEE